MVVLGWREVGVTAIIYNAMGYKWNEYDGIGPVECIRDNTLSF